MKSRLKDLLAGMAVFLVTGAILFAANEGAVRSVVDTGMNFNLEMWKYARDLKQQSSDPLIGHEHRPSAHAVLMGVEVVTNREGNRDREIPVERRPGVGRIAMLGNSFVLGWGVPAEDTVSARLTRMFGESNEPAEVMNTGVGNYNTVMEVEAFFAHTAKLKPDMVVLNYDFNDAEPVPAYRTVGFVSRHSAAYVFMAGGLDSALRLFGDRQRWDEYYLGLYDTSGWDAAKAAIHRLAVYCRQNDIKLVIANWPELHDIRNYRLQNINDLIRDVADAEQVPFVELLDALDGQNSPDLWVTAPDPHPNSRANALYAEYLYPRLRALMPRRPTAAVAQLTDGPAPTR